MTKTVEHKELVEAQREGAEVLDADTREISYALDWAKSEWGNETFYAEVGGTIYRIAPVEEKEEAVKLTVDVSEFTTAAAEAKKGFAMLKALSKIAYRND